MNRNSGKFIFSHILNFMPKHEFDQCVLRYGGNYRTRSFSCYDQFLCMAFAQLTSRESLRDIEICLKAMSHKLIILASVAQCLRALYRKLTRNAAQRFILTLPKF